MINKLTNFGSWKINIKTIITSKFLKQHYYWLKKLKLKENVEIHN